MFWSPFLYQCLLTICFHFKSSWSNNKWRSFRRCLISSKIEGSSRAWSSFKFLDLHLMSSTLPLWTEELHLHRVFWHSSNRCCTLLTRLLCPPLFFQNFLILAPKSSSMFQLASNLNNFLLLYLPYAWLVQETRRVLWFEWLNYLLW